MAIRRTPAAPKPKAVRPQKVVATSCWSCHTPLTVADAKFVMASLLDPTDLACSKRCYDDWCEAHPPPKPLG